jgi:hypothetical protein
MQPARTGVTAGVVLLGMALLAAGCGGAAAGAASEPAPQWVGQVTVVNRSSSDMDIFLVRRSERIRLGLAPNNTTTSFRLSPGQVGADLVRFVAYPLIGGGQVASTDLVHVSPGDTLELDIPPP